METTKQPEFCGDGYPTESTCQAIREWPYSDLPGLFDFMQAAWSYPTLFTPDGSGGYRISTGGWSGNEGLIDAMQENVMAWSLCWQSSKRGGHYEFEIPKCFRK